MATHKMETYTNFGIGERGQREPLEEVTLQLKLDESVEIDLMKCEGKIV